MHIMKRSASSILSEEVDALLPILTFVLKLIEIPNLRAFDFAVHLE